MVRREGMGSIPCWASPCMMAVAPPPVPLWRNVTCRDTMARGSCGPCLDPGKMVGIRAIPPLVEPTFRADQLPTDVLDLVVGKVLVDGLLTTLCCALRHGRCLCKLRLSGAESILLRVCFVLDVLARMMWRARTPGVDDGKPVQAACLEPPAPVPTGAGVGV